MPALSIKKISEGKYDCELNLQAIFQTTKDRDNFERKWPEFVASDKWNEKVLFRKGNVIKYAHKSWISDKNNSKSKMLIVGGNPAPHSAYEDIYYAYEITGAEHRYWKVLRELGIIDLTFDLKNMRSDFFDLNYNSPFLLGMEAGITFPSSASAPKWSGVQGLIKLFGSRAFSVICIEEKARIRSFADAFFQDSPGIIVAMQKHSFEALSNSKYSVKDAVTSKLQGKFNDRVTVFGTPPTRWLYTKKMKNVLRTIKKRALKIFKN